LEVVQDQEILFKPAWTASWHFFIRVGLWQWGKDWRGL